jgi:hypothetical protein
VSGEPIVLAGAEDGNAARLVHATARLGEAHLGAHALIGGLAVMCRLAAVHRATQDVDTVTETTVPTAVEVITSSIGTPDPSNAGRVIVDGVKIDVIDTASFRYEDLDGLDAGGRLFVVSHRWALDTATNTELVAGDATASIRVATPPALVAMKSGALLGGRTREPHKRASDLYDLYRVVLEYDRAGEIADALTTAPFRLGSLVGEALRSRVVQEPERAIRWLLDGGPEMHAVAPVDLLDVIGPLAGRLLQ